MLSQEIREVIQRHPNPEEQFHEAAVSYLKLAHQHADHFKLMFGAVLPIRTENHPELDRTANELFQRFVSIIELCQQAKVLRSGDPKQLALSAWSSIHGLVSLLINQNLTFLQISSAQSQSAMRTLTRHLIDGLRLS